jgi:hypothetical protein
MSFQKWIVCFVIPLISLSGMGCENFHQTGASNGWTLFNSADTFREEEEQYRDRFVTEGDSQAVRWLLKNRIASGMELHDVNQILGQKGARQFDDGWIKNNGGTFRQSDRVYKWGPDGEGKTYMLVFRDDHLVNFNSDDYE